MTSRRRGYFLKKRPDLADIYYYEDNALNGCSNDIKYLVTDFFKKCDCQRIDLLDGSIISRIENLASLVCAIANNTVFGEKISEKDIIYIKAIFKEVDALFSQSIKQDDCVSSRIDCLRHFFEQNVELMRPDNADSKSEIIFSEKEGMIFRDYRNLLIIMKIINEKYYELEKRGFSTHNVIDPFMEVMNNSCISEIYKFQLFMGVLNGKMKIRPVVEYRLVGHQIVDINTTGPSIINQSGCSINGTFLKEAAEAIPTNPNDAEAFIKKMRTDNVQY